MVKGVSTIIVIILLVIIAIALIFMLWLFTSSLFTSTTAAGKVSVQNTTYRMMGCLRIVDVDSKTGSLVLRNCGSTTLSNCDVFVDNSNILSDSRTFVSQSIFSIALSLNVGVHDIFVACDNAQSTHKTAVIIYAGAPQWLNSYINSTLAGTPILQSLEWIDNDGLSGFVFSFDNCLGSFTNDSSWVSMTGATNWSNVTKLITSNLGCTIHWKVYANDTHNVWSASPPFSYVTSGGGGGSLVCGNGICESGENQYNCPKDCGYPPSYCDFHIQSISSNTYTIGQNNKVYCLENNVHIDGKDAIDFSSGIQNSTLDCQGYNVDGNKTTNTYGVYLTGSNTMNETIKNCNITNFYEGVDLYNGPNNNLVNNNTIYGNRDNGIYLVLNSNNNLANNNTIYGNSFHGIYMSHNSNNNAFNNMIYGNSWSGIYMSQSSNNNLANNNTIYGNGYCGIDMDSLSSNNNLVNNTIYSNAWFGILIWQSSNNNAFNNMIYGNAIDGIFLESSSNNNITGGSVASSSSDDYDIQASGSNNNFTNTNFTTTRKINLEDATSWFNYQNDSSQGIWLKTTVSSAANLTRKLVNWNQNLMQWNDTSDTAITARYNVSGLLTNTNYTVYNNTLIPTYTLNSSLQSEIDFTITLPLNQQTNITVQKV